MNTAASPSARMRVTGVLAALLLSAACGTAPRQQPESSVSLPWLAGWLAAWELTSTTILGLPETQAPLMVFYDEQFVYTTAPVSAPEGLPFDGPTLFGHKLPWRKALHQGEITLPDGQQVPAQLMSFAAPLPDDTTNSFFVMAAPEIWQKAGIESKELGINHLLTAVFLHEFSHTRQMQSYGARISVLEKRYHLEETLNDNIVQDHFKQDSAYVRAFRAEAGTFFSAAFAPEKADQQRLARKALAMLHKRQAACFSGELHQLQELDDLFLTMEGCGQYVGVAWLSHPKGGNLPPATAVEGFRRDRSQWSQEEGLGMFLALTCLVSPDWQHDFFGPEPKYIPQILARAAE